MREFKVENEMFGFSHLKGHENQRGKNVRGHCFSKDVRLKWHILAVGIKWMHFKNVGKRMPF